MPHYSVTIGLARPVAEVFAFFRDAQNLPKLAPPDINLELVSAPALLELGATLVWKGRRWGISQQFTHEVTAYHAEQQIILEQSKGPFAKWKHAHQFETSGPGTTLVETIDFEPPGGLLGRLVTAQSILRDLAVLYAFREAKLKEMLVS